MFHSPDFRRCGFGLTASPALRGYAATCVNPRPTNFTLPLAGARPIVNALADRLPGLLSVAPAPALVLMAALSAPSYLLSLRTPVWARGEAAPASRGDPAPPIASRLVKRTRARKLIFLVTVLLAALFLVSAAFNLGARLGVGPVELSFQQPSASIATFEIAIGVTLLAAAAISRLYLYAGAYLFALVGVSSGLASPEVQGLARNFHEAMVPFMIVGYLLMALEARATYRSTRNEGTQKTRRELLVALQFFVGGLVTLGGAAFATFGTYPLGTVLGLVHLLVGLTGLLAGFAMLRKGPWPRTFLIAINGMTICYSALSETLAQIYALLPPGITDSLIGTVVAILASSAIIYLLVSASARQSPESRPESIAPSSTTQSRAKTKPR